MMALFQANGVIRAIQVVTFTTLLFGSSCVWADEPSDILLSNHDVALVAPTVAEVAPATALYSKPVPDSRFQKFSAGAGDLAHHAMSLLGIKYKYGGNTPESGLDCSGFVRYVFKQAVGATLPRTSGELSRLGTKVAGRDLALGDLVFFKTIKNAVSHVGIYIGEHKFIHAPSTGGEIRVDNIDQIYWKSHFVGGRRIIEKLPT